MPPPDPRTTASQPKVSPSLSADRATAPEAKHVDAIPAGDAGGYSPMTQGTVAEVASAARVRLPHRVISAPNQERPD
jgi:hypothetical protein